MKTDPLKRPKLHDAEKQEPYAGYYYHNSAKVPAPVIDEIKKSPYPCEHALLFDNINDLLNPGYPPLENGYCHMDNGGVFVAVLTQMPKVTGEMLDWWFWWHPMNSLRYRIWYPQTHFATTLDADPENTETEPGHIASGIGIPPIIPSKTSARERKNCPSPLSRRRISGLMNPVLTTPAWPPQFAGKSAP